MRSAIFALSDPVMSDIAAPEQRMRPEMKALESRLNPGSGDYLRRRRARGGDIEVVALTIVQTDPRLLSSYRHLWGVSASPVKPRSAQSD